MHLIVLFGPQAVGKMAVGRQIARLTGYRLFHNHATIEPLLGVFDWDEPSFGRLKLEFRRRVIEEVVASDLPGLILTFVWALDMPEDAAEVEEMVAPVLAAGHRVDFVELQASEQVRLGREGTEERLAAKSSKRDLAWARNDLITSGARYRLSTGPEQPFPLDHPHLVLDNERLSASEAAEQIVEALGLPRR